MQELGQQESDTKEPNTQEPDCLWLIPIRTWQTLFHKQQEHKMVWQR